MSHRRGGLLLIALGAFAGSLLFASAASAQNLTTLDSFNNSDGATPFARLTADANGNLFGTTGYGGLGYGTVFEVAKTATGYAVTPATLVSFDGTDGASPHAGLIADASGNLFGTTIYGGVSGEGTAYEIAKTTTGYGTPILLISFNGSDGALPRAALIADASGNLFGTTGSGGVLDNGTVFEIAKTEAGYAAMPSALVFNGSDGATPYAGLIADADGNLFGTTFYGGLAGDGTVFEIAKTPTGYATTPTTLFSFNGTDGKYPYAELVADAKGNLFGTTKQGGVSDVGTVFEIAKTSTGYATTPTTLASFSGTDGEFPFAALTVDANGSLFGTTPYGGVSGLGTVFEIANTTSGYVAAPITLVNFNGTDGEVPFAALIADGNGNLFGTTSYGGASLDGTVFELAGSGFVPPVRFAGVPGSANCHGVTISTLATTYGGVAYASTTLGYGSVADLQSAVAAFCGQ